MEATSEQGCASLVDVWRPKGSCAEAGGGGPLSAVIWQGGRGGRSER